jgi:hypothetical protein
MTDSNSLISEENFKSELLRKFSPREIERLSEFGI